MKQALSIIAFLLLVGVAAVAAKNIIEGTTFTPQDIVKGQPAQQRAADAMIANVRMEDGYKYVLDNNQFQVGQPVRLVFEMSTVKGCLRSLVIPGMGIRKTLSDQDNAVEFTPQKPGTYQMTCSMGMGQGSFTVI
ncbi:cupredoxin domain-containing protein [Candidatus Woesearchaeota archaeon]|nr:cupredoxin domain-containing protein [Candidatus Woesearchaeota archaeon]